MDLSHDFFALFDIEPGFDLQPDALASRYRELQRQYHPDRFAHSPEDQERAVRWTSHLNRAYDTLRDPVKRAAYLLERAGQPVTLTTSIADTDFLYSQLELREQMEEAASAEELASLRMEVEEWIASLTREFVIDFEEQDWSEARDTVRKLHFMANFLLDIRKAEDRLDDAYDDEDDD